MGVPQITETAQGRILDAAEQIFAADGFAGASMKTIASEAGVAQGLLHYHFANKEGLYSAVIAHRSGIINAERLAALDQLDLEAPGAAAQVMAALLGPPLGPDGGGRAYARIFGGLAGGEARDEALVAEHYDPTARAFIDALQRIYPAAERQAIAWGYNMAIGALMSVLGMQGRADRLAGAEETPTDSAATLDRLVVFAVGGLESIIAAGVPPDI